MVLTSDYIQKVLIATGIRDTVVGLCCLGYQINWADWKDFFPSIERTIGLLSMS